MEWLVMRAFDLGAMRGKIVEDSHDSDRVIIENGWHIFRGKLVGSVGYQETSLSNCTVTHDHASVEGRGCVSQCSFWNEGH